MYINIYFLFVSLDKTSASLQCVAAVRLRTPGMNGTSHHLMRYDISSKFDEADDAYAKENAKKTPSKDLIVKSDDVANPNQKMVMRVPTGYFTKVSRKRNREKVNRKMTPFFANFHEMDKVKSNNSRDCISCLSHFHLF